MSDIFETNDYVLDDNPYIDESETSELDEYADSAADIVDGDKFITKEDADGEWYKKTFSKVWDFIKGKIGIVTGSTDNTYLKKDGSFASLTVPVDPTTDPTEEGAIWITTT